MCKEADYTVNAKAAHLQAMLHREHSHVCGREEHGQPRSTAWHFLQSWPHRYTARLATYEVSPTGPAPANTVCQHTHITKSVDLNYTASRAALHGTSVHAHTLLRRGSGSSSRGSTPDSHAPRTCCLLKHLPQTHCQPPHYIRTCSTWTRLHLNCQQTHTTDADTRGQCCCGASVCHTKAQQQVLASSTIKSVTPKHSCCGTKCLQQAAQSGWATT